jgi:hypothetical protein
MAPEPELDWAEEIDKWGHGIDLEEALEKDIETYIRVKIYENEKHNKMDKDLWDLFQEDFQNFTLATISPIRTQCLQNLRSHLRGRGVYVAPNTKRTTIAQTLFDVIGEEEQHEWTDDEIQEVCTSMGTIKSMNLRYRIPQTPAATATIPPGTQTQPTATATIPPGTQTQPTATATIPPGTQTQPTATATIPPGTQTQPTATATIPTLHTTAPTQNAPNYGKEIGIVAKIYTEEQKYGGIDESFDYKLKIFYDICKRAGLPNTAYIDAFPTMLKGLAQDHFYNHDLSERPFDQACTHLRNFFEGPGYYRKNLDEWNATTLASIVQENTSKTLYQCLQLLITKLRNLQHGLTHGLRTTDFLHNKLVTACQGIPACRIAISDPPADFGHLINKLQSSIIAYEKEQNQTQAYFTDRRYHSRNRDRNDRGSRGRCYVCQKEDCRSWKHTEVERNKAKDEYKSRFSDRTGGRFDNRFKERFKQYILDCEGDEDSEDFDEAFETLIIDIGSELNSEKESESSTAYLTAFGSSTTYLTAFGELTPNEATSMSVVLANKAFSHSLTLEDMTEPTPATDPALATDPFIYTLNTSSSRYTTDVFLGIVVDTGASKKSTAGYGQFWALQQSNPAMELELDTSTKGQVTVQFGIGSTSSIGTANVHTPIGEVQFHIVDANTPFLLCLADMDKLQVYYNNIRDVLVTRTREVPVVRRFGHAFLLCNSSLQAYLLESFESNPCYLTEPELQRLHRRFGHPSVERLLKLLGRAGHDTNKKTLEHLTKYCHFCQKHGKSPGRFRFTLRDDIEFNYCIIVDIMYISGSPLLHVVDEGTRFQAGRWLQDISAKHTWEVLRMCWIDTYLGPPDLIASDAGKNFISKEFKHYASTMGICTKAVPVEAHNSIGMVERYHGPLRRVYQIIAAELPGIDRDAALQMAFKALNDTAGPDGLVPTLLVFGAYPRMTELDAPSPTVTQRANAVKKAMAEIRKLRAERQVADALNMRNGPRTDAVHDLPPNSPVLVWREGNTGQAGHWDGPYNLLTVEGETCTVKLPSGPTSFRSTVVKPYLQPESTESDPKIDPEIDPKPQEPEINPKLQESEVDRTAQPPIESQPQPVPKRGRGRPRKYPLLTAMADITIYLQDDYLQDDATQFSASRQKELAGLLEKGVFEITKLTDVPQGVRLFNSRFVDEIKNLGTDKAFEKSRLVVQAYNDQEKELVLTQSPTIQRVSQRLILCIAATKPDIRLFLRDISQAYVQSATNLNREFYVRPPRELGIDKDSVLKVLKPLYGVPEAGNHWFKTYHSHHVQQLHMDQSTYDPCLLQSNEPFGIVGLQTDDTLLLADETFAEVEQNELHRAKFMAKEREQLTVDTPLKFNGGLIQLVSDGITLTQERQCKNLSTITVKPAASTSSRGVTRASLTLKDQYIAQRARGAYIASVCQPEASFDLSFAAQVINPVEDDTKSLNKRLSWQIENANRGLKFVKLDINTLQLLVFTDASFANNKDLSSQIGYVIVLSDATKKANIVHWSSVKCKRVTRSVLASELYGMAHGFDIGAAIKSTVDKILQVNLSLILCTDSKSLYDCLVRLGTTQEKRLMIDVMCLRQAYERRQVTEVKWIDGNTNPADAMTKGKPCTALSQLIDTNRIELRAVGWVERTDSARV